MLKISKLVVKVGEKGILNSVDLEIKAREVVALMGPNGSGKSTLAQVIAGHPMFAVAGGKISFEGKNILEITPDERAKMGIFLANQYPVAIPGLPVHSLLWQMYRWRNSLQVNQLISKSDKQIKTMNLGDFRIWLSERAQELGMNYELLRRSLNDGFSGGEKKKVEILQMLVARPKLIILDEIDSGLDVDALKKIAQVVAEYAKETGAGVLVITHYSRILKYLKPNRAVVVVSGEVARVGGEELVEEVEANGYKTILTA